MSSTIWFLFFKLLKLQEKKNYFKLYLNLNYECDDFDNESWIRFCSKNLIELQRIKSLEVITFFCKLTLIVTPQKSDWLLIVNHENEAELKFLPKKKKVIIIKVADKAHQTIFNFFSIFSTFCQFD